MITIQETRTDFVPRVPVCFGIDFGTTFCCVGACVLEPEILGDLIPSVVSYDGIKAGQEAVMGPHFYSIKSFLDADSVDKVPTGANISYVTMAVKLFRVIVERIQSYYPEVAVPHAVITVPAYFNDIRRSIVKHAAQQAGIKVIRMISEPTAAMIAYKQDEEGCYGVYDLGGGTFDFSVVECSKGLYRVLATGGDIHCGGDHIDRALAAWYTQGKPENPCIEKLIEETIGSEHIATARAFKESASFQKKDCSQEKDVQKDHDVLSRIIDHISAKTFTIITDTLRKASLSMSRMNSIIVVGGSTKHQRIMENIKNFFSPLGINCTLDPDRAVAVGATLHAKNLVQNKSFLLLDITPLSLGIETYGGLTEVIIPRYTPLPVKKEVFFTTAIHHQKYIKIHVIQGEKELAQGCDSLGSFDVGPLSPAPQGQARVSVSFHMDADGLLTVTARETLSGQENMLTVNATDHLSDMHIKKHVIDAGSDVAERLWIQQKHHAEEAHNEVKRILASRSCDVVQKACKKLEEAIASQNVVLLQKEWESFLALAIPFIEDHMHSLLHHNLTP